MITRFYPEPITLKPFFIDNLFGPKSRDMIIVFEDQIQRPFMWTKYNIENDFMFEIFNTIKYNLGEKNERKHIYNDIGELVVSELDECSKKYFREEHNSDGSENDSNIDAGHRYKLSFATKFSFNLLCQNDDEIFDKTPFINDDGSLKIDGTNEKEFSGVKNIFEKDLKVKEIKKIISKTNKNIFKTTKDKTLLEVLGFVYNFISDKIKTDDVLSNTDINIINDYYSSYNYFYFSRVPLSQKWINFLTRNTGGQQATNEQMIPRDIGNHFNNIPGANEEIVNASNDVKSLSEECEKENKFVPTKKGYGMFLFAMQETLKNTYYENGFPMLKGDIVEDEKYKISSALKNHGIFKTKNDGISFFKKAYDFVDFVKKSIDFNEQIEKTYTFFLNEDRVCPCVWWYFLNPFFLLNKINNKEIEKEIHDILLRARAFYTLYRPFGNETNVQYLIDFLANTSNTIIKYNDNVELMVKEIRKLLYNDVLAHVKNAKKDLAGYSKQELFYENIKTFKSKISDLKYGASADRNVIKKILLFDEYITIKNCGISHYNLHNILISKEPINLDHIIPHSIIKNKFEDEDYDTSPLGNIVLLNEFSNKQKGANVYENDTIYRESNIYTTSLLVEDSRSNLPNSVLNKLNIRRYSKEEINSENFNYEKRTEEITNRIVKWIFESEDYDFKELFELNDEKVNEEELVLEETFVE